MGCLVMLVGITLIIGGVVSAVGAGIASVRALQNGFQVPVSGTLAPSSPLCS